MKYLIRTITFAVLISSCTQNSDERADEIVYKAINTHKGELFNKYNVSFDFRDKRYSVDRRRVEQFIYTREFEDSLGYIFDRLINSKDFSRKINDESIAVDEVWQKKYSNSINSVLYFFQLPTTLSDPAAKKKYAGSTEIKGEPYLMVKVVFTEENGGKDFEDEFMYWIHANEFTVDYLAYNYITDGGGVRFREAINRKRIKGLLLQDYINYQPKDKNTPLEKLPTLFEAGQLEELSKIINENIVVE